LLPHLAGPLGIGVGLGLGLQASIASAPGRPVRDRGRGRGRATGFDCFRTWQALALGTVPLVVDSGSFDARLLHGTGPQLIPSPDELTPDSLGALLAGLRDPAPHAPHVEMAHWR